MFQLAIARSCGFLSGNDYEPKPFSQFVLVPTHNFSQMTANAIANHRAADPP
jgi:hypothetical protein